MNAALEIVENDDDGEKTLGKADLRARPLSQKELFRARKGH